MRCLLGTRGTGRREISDCFFFSGRNHRPTDLGMQLLQRLVKNVFAHELTHHRLEKPLQLFLRLWSVGTRRAELGQKRLERFNVVTTRRLRRGSVGLRTF